VLGAALGIVAEHSLYGWGNAGAWVPDLLTGWCLIACGLLAAQLLNAVWTGSWLVAAGVAWFIPNFATSGWGGLSWIGAHALYVHRGLLLAAVVTYPRGRPTDRLEALVVGGLVVTSLVSQVWRAEAAAIVLAVATVGYAAYRHSTSIGRERRMRLRAFRATALIAGTIAATSLVRLASTGGSVVSATLHVYQGAVCATAAALLIGLIRRPWDRVDVTDLVVQLGATRSGVVRDALARALGDPTLAVGYRLTGTSTYVDAAGRPIEIPDSSSGRATTFVEQSGDTVAVLIHDPAVLDDPGLVGGVAAAAGLAAANIRLRAAVQARVAELRESRRRLLDAGDRERERLGQRLRDGAELRLAELGTALIGARHDSASPERIAQIAQSEIRLGRVRQDLQRLAVGLGPLQLLDSGLGHALATLAAEFPIPIELKLTTDELSPAASICAYFVCSEALANVAKYASASRVVVGLSTTPDDHFEVTIEDDGVGGADPAHGSGLRGLADRVEALGGTLAVISPPGAGTTLTATLPANASTR
jgi:signal transduction histidine kinase